MANITKVEKFCSNNTLTSRTDYSYVDRQLMRIQYYMNDGTSPGDYHTLEYQGTSPDPIRKSIFYGADSMIPAIVQEYTYDGKKSSFSASPGKLNDREFELFPIYHWLL
jgi:hypothetical protein